MFIQFYTTKNYDTNAGCWTSIWIYKIQCGLPLSLAQVLSGPTFSHVAQHNPQSMNSPRSTRLAIVGFVILIWSS